MQNRFFDKDWTVGRFIYIGQNINWQGHTYIGTWTNYLSKYVIIIILLYIDILRCYIHLAVYTNNIIFSTSDHTTAELAVRNNRTKNQFPNEPR